MAYQQGSMASQDTRSDCDSLATDTTLTDRRVSRVGIRNIFSRSKSVLGNRTPRKKTRLDSFTDLLPDESPSLHKQRLSSSPSTSLLSRATTSSSISTKPSSWTSGRNKPRVLTSWDPPPLFQAFPQSIMCSTLDTSCTSADSIIKNDQHRHRRRSSIDEHIQLVGELFGDSNEPAASTEKNHDATFRKHRRSVSASFNESSWTRKLFILITSGYLLQYSAEGHHDRLPEKILALSKDSVAFASDAIAGKHWVLQVSQHADDDGRAKVNITKRSWGLFNFRSTEARRTAKSILLVFDSAEEFDTWMSAVRKEIEALGGLQYRVTSPSHEPQKPVLEHRLSQRYQIRKDPQQFSDPLPEFNRPLPDLPPASDICECDNIIGDHKALVLSLPAPGACRQSIAASSTLTTTELDALRRSTTSSTSAVTPPRSSDEESTTPALPAIQEPPNISPEASIKAWQSSSQSFPQNIGPRVLQLVVPLVDQVDDRRKSVDSHTLRSPTFRKFLTAQADKDRPISSIPNFSLPTSIHRLSQGSSIEAVHTQDCSKNQGTGTTPGPNDSSISDAEEEESQQKDRPVSTLAPLPNIGMAKASRSTNRLLDSSPPLQPLEMDRSDDTHRKSYHQQQHITTRPPSAGANYGFFPRRHSSLEYTQVQLTAPSPPPQCDLPDLPLNVPKSGRCPPTHTLIRPNSTIAVSSRVVSPTSPRPASTVDSSVGTATPKPLRRPVSMQIRTERLKQCHSTAERSPSVTDVHFATCFGTEALFLPQTSHLTRSASVTSMASASCSSVPSSFTASTMSIPSPVPSPGARKVSPRKSSATLGGLDAKPRPPPAGPPPNCPLPAVPVGRTSKRRARSRDVLDYQRELMAQSMVMP